MQHAAVNSELHAWPEVGVAESIPMALLDHLPANSRF
jgi:hypothetical protein